MNSPRGGSTRWGGQARPGDLTGTIGRRNQARAEAVRKAASEAADAETIRREAYAEGFDRGFDRGFNAGYEAALQQFRDAGLDVDAVLALDAEEEE